MYEQKVHGPEAKEVSSTDTGSFVCTKCGKKLERRSVSTHMQLHTGQFSFYCELCRKGFVNITHYKAHIRGHEGLKYHCEYCSKSYMDKQKLMYHLSVHTGLYRFHCDTCGKGFNVKANYNRHLKSHAVL